MTDIASRTVDMRRILPTVKAALEAFQSSSAGFRVISTVNGRSRLADIGPRVPAHPKTLFILDSSYNPPSRAHLALASTALDSAAAATENRRLLLLFSTHNADKAPSPASFEQRIAMMMAFAADLQDHMDSNPRAIEVDIGLTTSPYYTDKSSAISTAEPSPYPSNPTHIHLLGYDTLTRFLAPKYYPKYSPPLSALEPFFDRGHRLLVLLRPNSSSDNAVTSDTEQEQRAYISGLHEGSLEAEGFKRQWAKQIDILEGSDAAAAEGISSTTIRKACKKHDWNALQNMCTPTVAAWVKDQKLYEDDDRGAKMA